MTRTTTHSDNKTLANHEYRELLTALGETVKAHHNRCANQVERDKINEHNTWIASQNILTLTDPSNIFDASQVIARQPLLQSYYAQVYFHLFSQGIYSSEDGYDRLCASIARAVPCPSMGQYGLNYSGDIYEIARRLYKKKWLDYFIKPSPVEMVKSFLVNHRHLVIQVLIMQFYQLKV